MTHGVIHDVKSQDNINASLMTTIMHNKYLLKP